jgi:hypothetical protein
MHEKKNILKNSITKIFIDFLKTFNNNKHNWRIFRLINKIKKKILGNNNKKGSAKSCKINYTSTKYIINIWY